MRVTKKTSSMVKPSEPTWSGRLALSELDQTGMTSHVPTIYFYAKPNNDYDTVVKTLKTSLSNTLVHFYPLAGRLTSVAGGRLELDCNAAGVQFTEAHADGNLLDVGDFLLSPMIHHLIPSVDYRRADLEETPLLLLQVTRFNCEGLSIGFSVSHVVADGQSALHFVSEWARVCRGEPLGSLPYLDRKVLRASEGSKTTTCSRMDQHVQYFSPPPLLIGQSSNENERRMETNVTMLKLTKTLVENLQKNANKWLKTKMDRGFTRYEAVTAHIWRTACKVRNHEPHQPTALSICIDVRTRMKPPLPEKYFGNAIVDVVATGSSDEIVLKPLGFVSSKIRDMIEKVDDKYVHSVIDFLKNEEDLSKFQDFQTNGNDQGPFHGNPNLGVVSWLTLPMYGVDFGWGKEVYTGPGTDDYDGDFLVIRGQDGDGSLVVPMCLQVRHIEDFKREFYQSIDME